MHSTKSSTAETFGIHANRTNRERIGLRRSRATIGLALLGLATAVSAGCSASPTSEGATSESSSALESMD